MSKRIHPCAYAPMRLCYRLYPIVGGNRSKGRVARLDFRRAHRAHRSWSGSALPKLLDSHRVRQPELLQNLSKLRHQVRGAVGPDGHR